MEVPLLALAFELLIHMNGAGLRRAAHGELHRHDRQAQKQQAEDILASARTKAYELEQKISGLESRYELMKTRIKLLLYAEIELLDKGEVLAEKEAKAQETK